MARKKPEATIFQDDNGCWKIKTDIEWVDTFDTEEDATTYALREGCKVAGC